ncbi:DUF4326 domain-containing protein [Modestobacter sp. VKM Ac-2985]|uniref:DUF4326 domain-containing protein n=1 Tax=Modestobacter sp. VKM Ac-2985 TaxID=3004139 RepID=UPI0022ABA8C3|nr:DUF4326 domain-containing protein [Modestobacter sp. VKM Ac-2985]MCZ2837169.1 DUF4326 domain-containing protein [Modestobacter sp. VKM Ac-2985]
MTAAELDRVEWVPGQQLLAPRRIQLKRSKGWRKPADAVVVARPSKWGNPYKVGGYLVAGRACGPITPAQCVDAYRALFLFAAWGDLLDLGELVGRDLACWCPPDRPCHADVLLELANSEASA